MVLAIEWYCPVCVLFQINMIVCTYFPNGKRERHFPNENFQRYFPSKNYMHIIVVMYTEFNCSFQTVFIFQNYLFGRPDVTNQEKIYIMMSISNRMLSYLGFLLWKTSS